MRRIKITQKEASGKTLLQALTEKNIILDGTCGGRGTCGRCKVKTEGVEVLACRKMVDGDMEVTVPEVQMEMWKKHDRFCLPEGFLCDAAAENTYGIALDLGTTTVVVMLWDLFKGVLIDMDAVTNPQCSYGADVMSRLAFAMKAPWNLKRLQSSLINEINQSIAKLALTNQIAITQIRKITAVGNTAMSHLFLGEDIRGLTGYPFQPSFMGSVVIKAGVLGLAAHGDAEVYVAPNMAGHVGSDITAGVLAWQYAEKKDAGLLLDIGTNGELFLISKGRAFCCSTAAGPAFEGHALTCGMRSQEGAVKKVNVTAAQVGFETIGGKAPCGICGSGVIDSIGVMVETGILDRFGQIQSREAMEEVLGMNAPLLDHIVEDGEVHRFVIFAASDGGSAVFLTQKDIREIQMAKAAVSAGIKLLAAEAGIAVEDLDEIGIAGAFGSAIDPKNAMNIGLLPKVKLSKIKTLGNAAGLGASMLLLSQTQRDRAESLVRTVEHVELAGRADFEKQYIQDMVF